MKLTAKHRLALLAPLTAAGLALPLVFAGTASAASSTVVRNGSSVAFFDNSSNARSVTFSQATNGQLQVQDSAGLFTGPGCTRVSSTTALCGFGVRQISANIGDGNDSVTNTSATVLSLSTGSGSDHIFIRNGHPDYVSCGSDHDTVTADPRIDVLSTNCLVG